MRKEHIMQNVSSASKGMDEGTIGTLQNFKFSGVKVDELESTEYTLVSIAVDISASVYGFDNELLRMLKTAVGSCKNSPRADNLLVRVITFSTMLQNGFEEVHGFKLLSEIDPDDYQPLRPGGGTPLFDATFSSIGSVNEYAKRLADDDYLANGIAFVITDGEENSSVATEKMICDEIVKARRGEHLESLISILVGINAQSCAPSLDAFRQNAGLDEFIDAGTATPGKLARLAAFVSQSVSSQSQALGTGGPSKQISTTI